MKTILITGFEPFGGEKINPALEAITRLESTPIEGAKIITCSVPVVHQKSIDTVIAAIEQHKPDFVMTVGQAGGRAAITPERIAINLDDYRIPDNEGNQVTDQPVVADGPAAYFSTLPIKAMTKAIQDKGIPAQVSSTAGTYVCNHLFYGVQHYLRNSTIGHGFVHIPLMSEQAIDGSKPTLSLDLIVEGLAAAAQAIVSHKQDIDFQGGSIC
ncbi:pyroglutamyl-peptidase I [Psychromonas sp. KJ10-2]|uniref:pyroglutamyl-peptidase I n=1 Tax=Psychromonas sp. KJ10-2 TaxID=3391822 RepID=UPI0039B5D796